MGYDAFLVNEEHFTTSSVIDELHLNTTANMRLKLALENKKIRIHTPSLTSLKEVEETSRRVGDLPVLSKVDKDVLASALDFQRRGFVTSLVSDDYAVQNVAEFLGLNYFSLTTLGIRYRFKWIFYCPACNKQFTPELKKIVCSICGTRLKRKVVEKRSRRKHFSN